MIYVKERACSMNEVTKAKMNLFQQLKTVFEIHTEIEDTTQISLDLEFIWSEKRIQSDLGCQRGGRT